MKMLSCQEVYAGELQTAKEPSYGKLGSRVVVGTVHYPAFASGAQGLLPWRILEASVLGWRLGDTGRREAMNVWSNPYTWFFLTAVFIALVCVAWTLGVATRRGRHEFVSSEPPGTIDEYHLVPEDVNDTGNPPSSM
jgi:hypothetical protein